MLVFYLNPDRATERVTIFMHMPKTGGNTFNVILNKPFTDIDCIVRLGAIEDLTMEELQRTEMVRGHMHFGLHTRLPQKQFDYITFVRNPIERVISYFYYMGSSNNLDNETRELFNKIPLEDFVMDEPNNQFNLQTNLLAGLEVEPDTTEALALAKANLRNWFSIVGVTERYHDSLRVWQQKFRWQVQIGDRRNVTADRPALSEIPEEIIELIRGKSRLDLELHQFANQLLDEELKLVEKNIDGSELG